MLELGSPPKSLNYDELFQFGAELCQSEGDILEPSEENGDRSRRRDFVFDAAEMPDIEPAFSRRGIASIRLEKHEYIDPSADFDCLVVVFRIEFGVKKTIRIGGREAQPEVSFVETSVEFEPNDNLLVMTDDPRRCDAIELISRGELTDDPDVMVEMERIGYLIDNTESEASPSEITRAQDALDWLVERHE